jgi:hypothetical protein
MAHVGSSSTEAVQPSIEPLQDGCQHYLGATIVDAGYL